MKVLVFFDSTSSPNIGYTRYSYRLKDNEGIEFNFTINDYRFLSDNGTMLIVDILGWREVLDTGNGYEYSWLSFEEVFNIADDELKKELVFHLDILNFQGEIEIENE